VLACGRLVEQCDRFKRLGQAPPPTALFIHCSEGSDRDRAIADQEKVVAKLTEAETTARHAYVACRGLPASDKAVALKAEWKCAQTATKEAQKKLKELKKGQGRAT